MSKYQKAFVLTLGFTVLGTMVYHARTYDGFVDYRSCEVQHENGPVGGKCDNSRYDESYYEWSSETKNFNAKK